MKREAWSAILGGMAGAVLMLVIFNISPMQAQEGGASKSLTVLVEDVAARQNEMSDRLGRMEASIGDIREDTNVIRERVEGLWRWRRRR